MYDEPRSQEEAMRRDSASVLIKLRHEEREIRRQALTIRRRASGRMTIPTLGENGSANLFDAALEAAASQPEEIAHNRLADRSRALAEALAGVRDGTYGICRACGDRIPRRRLEALPTATLCVTCQERREAA
jgi:RNA polymerase-binding transcription factor DksA